jgi:hypothetical protein
MNTEALFLFLILLLGLVLCSFLGGNCGREGFSGKFSGKFKLDDNVMQSSSGVSTPSQIKYDNYNHYTGSSTELSPGATFYGEKGRTATVISDSDGNQSLEIILPGSTTPVTFTTTQQPKIRTSTREKDTRKRAKNKSNSCNVEGYDNYYGQNKTYYGPDKSTATIIKTDNGQQAIKVTNSSGTYYYNTSGEQITSEPDSSTKYYGSTGYTIQIAPYSMSYQGPYEDSVKSTASTEKDYPYYGPHSTSDYYSTLPAGIPKSQIPNGQEDLYILKSQVVPPVCPACPSSSVCPRQEPCPPCPACARCPEQEFECKKVPNYRASKSGSKLSGSSGSGFNSSSSGFNSSSGSGFNSSSGSGFNSSSGSGFNSSSGSNSSYNGSNYNATNNYPSYGNNQYLPAPVLNDFSTFGM